MDDVNSALDPDELMDLEEADGSDIDDDEEDVLDVPSPLQIPSSGPGSTATSTASSPPNNDDGPSMFNFSGKPLSIKRGRGRPRREGGSFAFPFSSIPLHLYSICRLLLRYSLIITNFHYIGAYGFCTVPESHLFKIPKARI